MYVYVCVYVCIHPLGCMPEGFLGFLIPRANTELVLKFHLALHAVYAAFPVLRPKFHLSEVPSTFLNFRLNSTLPLQVCTTVQPKLQ
jgi:hypothetical protein